MPLALSCNNPPAGTVGLPYSSSLLASGGTAPYTYAIIGGALPPGLTLAASTGVISGLPRDTGPFAFTAQVTDNVAAQASVNCSITVAIVSAALPLFALRKVMLAIKPEPGMPVRGAGQ